MLLLLLLLLDLVVGFLAIHDFDRVHHSSHLFFATADKDLLICIPFHLVAILDFLFLLLLHQWLGLGFWLQIRVLGLHHFSSL